jgi:hypothetical protein
MLDAATAAATKKFREEISNYNNAPKGQFMPLLLYTLQLKSSPYWDSPEVTGLRNDLPDSIKTITTSNFCLKNSYFPYYMFAFQHSHFDPPMADSRIGVLYNLSRPRTGAEWTIEASEDGKSVYLKNILLDQYLYATEDQIHSDSANKKMAFGRKENGDSFKWVFLPKDNIDSWFFVQNVEQKASIEWACGPSKAKIRAACLCSCGDQYHEWKFVRC